MQRRSLSSFFHKILEPFVGIKKGLNIYGFERVFIPSYELEKQTPIIKSTTIKPSVCIKENLVNFSVKIVQKSQIISNVLVRNIEMVYHQMRWREENLQFISISRKYPMDIPQNAFIMDNTFEQIEQDTTINDIPPKEIELQRKIQTTEEIIGMDPFLYEYETSKLYSIPITKQPIPKSNFKYDEIRLFITELARQNSISTNNVELLQIFDKIDSSIFSVLKQDNQTKTLECTPKESKQNEIPKSSKFLLIGRNKESKEKIKAFMELFQ